MLLKYSNPWNVKFRVICCKQGWHYNRDHFSVVCLSVTLLFCHISLTLQCIHFMHVHASVVYNHLMNLQSLTRDISRSSFIHSSVCCQSVRHIVLFCHISLTLQCIYLISCVCNHLQNLTCHGEGSHFFHHISQQVTCVPWVNLVYFVFVVMGLHVTVTFFSAISWRPV